MGRVILHCDLDAFYASVELLGHPELRDRPVAVCGDPAARHGVILAKNAPARRMGVRTAETVWQARRKCPDLILLPPHHDAYREWSRRVNAVYDQYTDRVEPFSIDESWLDVTGTLHLFGGDARALADGIRRRIREELGLTVSIGVSFNKVFAKLGSDYRKPDATTVIPPDGWRDLVWPLPVGDLLFVGRAARTLLHRYGVETIGDLAAFSPEVLGQLCGKIGPQLHQWANGLDRSPVRTRAEAGPVKSVGRGTTFPRDLGTRREVRQGVALLADDVASRLRRHGLYAGGVSVTVRDPDLRDRSRQRRLPAPTRLIRDLTGAAMELAEELWRPPARVRAITVTAIHLVGEEDAWEQGDLFVPREGRARQEELEGAMARIREKYGEGSIVFGASVAEEKGRIPF